MAIDVRRLLVLRAVRDAGGAAAAAAALHVSTSAVSQQLAKLERESGLRLATRTAAGRLELTAAGRRLAAHADDLAAVLDATVTTVDELHGIRERVVTIAAFPSAVRAVLVPAARALSAGCPPIRLRIVEVRSDESEALRALRSGGFDVVLCKEPVDELPGITRTPLAEDPFVAVVPAAWPEARHLDGAPWVTAPETTAAYTALGTFESLHGLRVDRAHTAVEYAIALDLVRAGLAGAIVPTLALPADDGRIRVVGSAPIGARPITACALSRTADAVGRVVAHLSAGATLR